MTAPINEDTERAFSTTNTIRSQGTTGSPDPNDSLLNLEPKDAAKQMLKDWDESWKELKGIAEQWKANKARLDGYTGVRMVKKQDHAEAYIPLGAEKSVGGLNKAARLLRRITANIFADKPLPECTPAGDDDNKKDAAESGTRILQYQCSEGQLDYALAAQDAFRRGGVYGSGFVRFWVDMNGGGYLPQQIEALPDAVDPADPFPVDPMTGQKKPGTPILRYVTEGSDEQPAQFTEDRTQAKRTWYPKLRREILTGKHVRFIPFQVQDLWEADGVMVGAAVPLKTVKDTFPEVAKWPSDRLAKLVQHRPQHFKDLLPAGQKDQGQGEVKDTTLCFLLMRWHVQSPKYPNGAYLVAGGSDEILYRGEWFDTAHVRPLDIPLTQFKHYAEEDNPYGSGVMQNLGPGNEIRDAMLLSQLEHLDRFNRRKIFVSMVSPLAGQPQLMQTPTGFPIPILPGTEPKYEEIPDFPVIVEKMLQFSNLDMDDESGLQQQAQAMNSPSVTSGKQADTILETVKKGLTDLWDNTERGLVRGWRIMMQLDRAFIGDIQLMRFQGADGAFKLDRWTGEDFGDTEDVRVQRGTFTGMSPQQKAQQAVMFTQLGILNKQDLEHVTEGGIGGLFGLQDNPHRLRVRRQIAQWQEGPPEGWQPPQAPMDPMTGQPQMDPQSGQPMPAPPDPTLAGIFDQLPADTEPEVAMIRVYELGRVLAGTAFKRWPPAWGEGLVGAYQAARQAAQVLDAEASAKMQQELQQAKEKNSGAKVSVSLKGSDLDQGQTMAILEQEGIQVPPPIAPDLTPMQKAEVDITKHRISAAAGIGKQVVKGPPQPAASGSPR